MLNYEFKEGMRVVCVDARPGATASPIGFALKVGEIYQIDKLIPFKRDWTLQIDNVILAKLVGNDSTDRYGLWRFKPLEEQSKAIELFRTIAQGKTTTIPDDAPSQEPKREKEKVPRTEWPGVPSWRAISL